MEFNEAKKDFKRMTTKGPLVGIVLVLAGLLVGWFAWGTHEPVEMHDENSAPIEAPATIANGENTTPVVAEMDMTMGLADKTGAEFDKAFLEEMIKHHEQAVTMAKLVLVKSTRTDLIAIA